MRFSISTARKKLAWLRVQSEANTFGGSLASSSSATVRAANRSSSLRRTPLTAGAHLVERLRVLHVHQREAGVGVRPGRPRTRRPRVNCFRRGITPAGRDDALRRDQRDLVAAQHAERAREVGAEHHAELAGAQRVERAGAHVLRRGRRLCPPRPAGCRAPRRRASTGRCDSMACACTKGARRHHARVLRGDLGDALPVREAVVVGEDLQVRDHAEDARAHFLLEAVHHRQHHDQRPHADRDADHRDRGVDADEAVAAPGARIAQADHELVSHWGGARILQSTQWTPRPPGC